MASPRGNMADVRANLNSKVKISLDRIIKVCSALQVGAPVRTAAAFAGVSEKTIYNWISRAGDVMAKADAAGADAILSPDDRLYIQFGEQFLSATAKFELTNLQIIAWAASGGKGGKETKHWQAAAWLLERRKPNEYGMNRQAVDEPSFTDDKEKTEPVPQQELDVYNPERLARLFRGAEEAGVAPAQSLTRIVTSINSASKKK
jgi:hypothetical protein